MCGITGVFAFAASSRDEHAHVRRMRHTMVHRGPDDAGIWQDRAIVDPSPAGHQPIANEDGYNHERLREPLRGAGHVFRSRCDAQVILHGYEEYGDEVVSHLDGMFAFGLWDARARRLLLARDRLGKKPLCDAEVGGRLLFARDRAHTFDHSVDLWCLIQLAAWYERWIEGRPS